MSKGKTFERIPKHIMPPNALHPRDRALTTQAAMTTEDVQTTELLPEAKHRMSCALDLCIVYPCEHCNRNTFVLMGRSIPPNGDRSQHVQSRQTIARREHTGNEVQALSKQAHPPP
ncbi:hypothetical protein E5676_scaffold172G00410 [Cucumis melo var. makuwa]|uniref:Uncharacterized protein n=1 Tax=Cucumis melo var. makuwa TaxID=1194695 RepID=A0A5D3E6K2_CUCMM|nr:hypothetical protein E5676_scaffold172G00410 [Cucumis melo var. makuwa]